MKITKFDITNVLGARRVCLDLPTPITILCGHNGNGKTSVLEACRMALTGEPPRDVSLKKHFAQLVNDQGAKTGQAEVFIAGREDPAYILVPKGAGLHLDDPVLPFLLDASRFAKLDEKGRRAFLFGLMGLKITQKAVAERLAKRGLDEKKCERVLPLLRAGFDEASKEAATIATQNKGAWREITGEAYGSVKSEDWKASAPTFDQAKLDDLLAQAATADQALATANENVGKLKAIYDQVQANTTKRASLQASADRLDRIAAKLKVDEAEQADLQAKLAQVKAARETQAAMACPCCDARLLLRNGSLVDATTIGAPGTEDDIARIPALEEALRITTNAVNNDRRDLADAQAARAQLASMDADAGGFNDQDLIRATHAAEDARTARRALTVQIDTLNAAKRAGTESEAKTAKAAALHADVIAWTAIAEALGPTGIPAEMLVEAMDPINARLLQSSQDAEWPQVVIHSDMRITYGLRSYHLLSESERWRADAMLAEAISHLSRLKLMFLDRFDVLDLKGREDALAWLDILAQEGEVETVLIGATLKAPPPTTAFPATVSSAWIAQGHCDAVISTLKAAA